MTNKAKELLRELDECYVRGCPNCPEKFQAICKKMAESGLVDAEFLSEAFQSVYSEGREEGFSDGYDNAREEQENN